MTEPDADPDRPGLIRRRLVQAVAGLAALAVVGSVVVVLTGGPVTVVLVLLPIVLAGAVCAGLLALLLRRPFYRRVMQYGTGRKKDVHRAIRAGRPLTPPEAEVAAAQLELMERSRWLPWLQIVTVALLLVNAFNDHGPLRWVLFAAVGLMAVLLPVGLLLSRRDRRRYRDAVAGAC